MNIKRITIVGDSAHFKVPVRGKIQQTYEIPQISTIVGILQNIYGEEINDFIIGYKIQYKSKEREAMRIYKEFDLLEKTEADKERFKTDLCIVESLHSVELNIYTDINKEIILNDVLVLGKANYLATIKEIKDIEFIDKQGYGYNQYTNKDIGQGQIRRVNTITKYNETTDRYDIKAALARENIEFEYDRNYDSDLEENIYLWKWKDGEVFEIN